MKFIKYVGCLLLLLLVVSCDSDYSGKQKTDQQPVVGFKDSPVSIDGGAVEVSWYGNDLDDYKLEYYYAISSDINIESNKDGGFENSLLVWPDTLSIADGTIGKWKKTTKSKLFISMPYNTLIDTVITTTIDNADTTIVDTALVCYGKLWLYAQDEKGVKSEFISKTFGRTNQLPRITDVKSTKFGDNLKHLKLEGSNTDDPNHYYVKFPTLILKERTELWQPIDFNWAALDPDGDVSLYYTYKVYYHPKDPNNEGVFTDSVDIVNPRSYDTQFTSLSLDSVLYKFNAENGDKSGNYTLELNVKDDANSLNIVPVIIDMDFFFPEFDKGILVIDDTADTSEDDHDNDGKGNPSKVKLKSFYEELFAEAGYNYNNTGIKSLTFLDASSDTFEEPTLSELVKYRLVIFINEGYGKNSITFTISDLNSFGSKLNTYMDIGGKVMLVGASASVDDIGKSLNKYEIKDFTADTVLGDHFGLKSVFKSIKYERDNTADLDDTKDLNFHNYDFLGMNVEYNAGGAVPDSLKITPMYLNSDNLKSMWWNFDEDKERDYRLKENNTVLPGINAFSISKGQTFLSYYSIGNDYDGSDVTSVKDVNGNSHDLYLPNNSEEKIIFMSDQFSSRPFIGNRLIQIDSNTGAELFRSMVVGVPLYSMDNSNDVVTNNFKAFIKWFELYNNPLDRWK